MRKLLLLVTTLVGLALPALARTVEQQILEKLAAQGYVILEQGYTFLGRLRIVAENDTFYREIVVNPGTGEILRDYAVTLNQKSSPPIVEPLSLPSSAPLETEAPRNFSASEGPGDDGVRLEGDTEPVNETSAIVEENRIEQETSDSFGEMFVNVFDSVFEAPKDELGTQTGPIELVLPESILQMEAGAP
jgi:hypothetical protein